MAEDNSYTSENTVLFPTQAGRKRINIIYMFLCSLDFFNADSVRNKVHNTDLDSILYASYLSTGFSRIMPSTVFEQQQQTSEDKTYYLILLYKKQIACCNAFFFLLPQ